MNKNNILIFDSPQDLFMWVDALASCAIEGNQLAKRGIDLWHKGKTVEFLEFIEKEFRGKDSSSVRWKSR